MPSVLPISIDSAARGSSMDKEEDKAQWFIELLAHNDDQWVERERDRKLGKKVAWV